MRTAAGVTDLLPAIIAGDTDPASEGCLQERGARIGHCLTRHADYRARGCLHPGSRRGLVRLSGVGGAGCFIAQAGFD